MVVTAMTFKRRNGGRNKHGRGHVRFIRCDNCGKSVPKDKAIKRYKVQNIVAPENISYFTEAPVLDGYHLPKIYIKERWCVGCAIHMKRIGIRSRKDRKNRAPPEDVRRRGPRPMGQAPRPGGVGGGPGGVGGGSGGTGGGASGGFGAGAPAPNAARRLAPELAS